MVHAADTAFFLLFKTGDPAILFFQFKRNFCIHSIGDSKLAQGLLDLFKVAAAGTAEMLYD